MNRKTLHKIRAAIELDGYSNLHLISDILDALLDKEEEKNKIVPCPADCEIKGPHLHCAFVPEPRQPEIRPQAGEVWQANGGRRYFIHALQGCLYRTGEHELHCKGIPLGEMVHGQNGWHRIYPPVQEDRIDRDIP